MGGRTLLALGLLVLAGPTSAQDQETINKALEKEMQAYTDCIRDHVDELAKSTDAAEAVADKAIDACPNERHAVWVKMQESPLGASPGDATAAIQQTNDGLRPLVIDAVKKARRS